MSVELNILIEAIKICFLNQNSDGLKLLINTNTIDYNKLKKLVSYHSIRPILYNVIQKNSIQFKSEAFNNWLEQIAIQNTMYSLVQIKETANIISILKEQNILAIPYKGSIFIKEIYDGSHLRESGDIDILVKPDEAIKALTILEKHDYKNTSETNHNFTTILTNTSYQEFSLKKDTIHIDFHRAFHSPFLPYKMDYQSFFYNLNESTFINKKIAVPNNMQICSMLVIHNGGKELWLKFKHLVDLALFIKNKDENFNWEEVIKTQKKQRTYVIFKTGLFLLRNKFNFQLPSPLIKEIAMFSPKKLPQIEAYWENAENWDNYKNRIKYEFILTGLQDKGFSIYRYIKNFISFKSEPHLTKNIKGQTIRKYNPIKNFIARTINYLSK